MNPRLVAVRGPLEGNTFSITQDEFSIGRTDSNAVFVPDPHVSRHHCIIERKGEDFEVRDLESSNGTFVNGIPVKSRLLEHGDRISLSGSTFVFLVEEAQEIPAPLPVQFDENELNLHSTAQLNWSHSLYLQEDLARERIAPERLLQGLNTLLKISTTINRIRDLKELQEQLLESIFEAVPAEQGAILTITEAEAEHSPVCFKRSPDGTEPLRVSKTVLKGVLETGKAILSSPASGKEMLEDAKSLAGRGTQSVLAVPLMVFEKLTGVIYLETSHPTTTFNENHLELLTAIAALAAVAFENVQHVYWLENENRRLREEFQIEHSMIGESTAMRKVYDLIARLAPTDSTGLIRGENGTGKELVARAIHQNSPRADRPFIAINCAALTETLLESELFGHEKGAFTGAIAQKRGKLEIADKGTVFLDEVGELALPLQAKLLRVLQEHEFERVGGTQPIRLDIRLIAATNKDLEKAIEHGSFRPDLYYRLNVVSLTMPPLRERREDIPLLAQYFVAKYSQCCGRPVTGISPQARSCLMRYDWPGNVRELENAMERAVVLGWSELLLPEDLPEAVLEAGASRAEATAYHEALTQKKKELILNAFAQANGSYTEAARCLGLHPNYLHRLIRNLNLKEELRRRSGEQS